MRPGSIAACGSAVKPTCASATSSTRAAFNLGLLMRSLFGVGTPREAASRLAALLGPIRTLIVWVFSHPANRPPASHGPSRLRSSSFLMSLSPPEAGSSTGC
ncbi:MAG: hypothetical protein SangKO_001670 [Sandaracinaceae bacterium]